VEASKDPTEMKWNDTMYVLVVEIDKNHRAGAVWALFNFNCVDPDSALRVRRA
jgi:hypothetical protein